MERAAFEMLAAGVWPSHLHNDLWDELERVAPSAALTSVSTALVSVRFAILQAVRTEAIRRDCAEIAVLIEA